MGIKGNKMELNIRKSKYSECTIINQHMIKRWFHDDSMKEKAAIEFIQRSRWNYLHKTTIENSV